VQGETAKTPKKYRRKEQKLSKKTDLLTNKKYYALFKKYLLPLQRIFARKIHSNILYSHNRDIDNFSYRFKILLTLGVGLLF